MKMMYDIDSMQRLADLLRFILAQSARLLEKERQSLKGYLRSKKSMEKVTGLLLRAKRNGSWQDGYRSALGIKRLMNT